VSAKQKLSPPLLRALVFLCLFFAIFFLYAPVPSRADSLEDGARALARKVAAKRIENLESFYTWQNLANVSPAASERMRKAFEEELSKQHIQLELKSSSDLSATITEGPSLILLIATLGAEKSELIATVSFPKSEFTSTERLGALLRLNHQLLWQQPEPILDIAQSESPAGIPELLLVLGKTTLSLYRRGDEAWILKDAAPLPKSRPALRDMRGEIHLDDHFFQFHLPGFECDGDAWQKLDFECEERNGIWRSKFDPMIPFSLDAGQHSFRVDPHYIGSKRFPLVGFFSAADSYQSRIDFQSQTTVAGADGHVYVYSSGDEEKHIPESLERLPVDWGGDLASLQTGCGEGLLVLATGPHDHTHRDTLQGFEVNPRAVTAQTSAAEFPGPILALRPDGDSAAIAIVFNLSTGNYEAYRVTMECGD
jgi:hypothetical protein